MYKLYYHNSSKNHGCEAIVRSTKKIFSDNMKLFSWDSNSDIKYGLNSIVEVIDDIRTNLSCIERLKHAFYYKLNKSDYLFTILSHRNFFDEINKYDICFSIGGDNYCYAGKDIIGHYNKAIHKRGAKTVYWGCSFEPKDMNDEIAKDIALYDLIVARETISYDLLKSVNPNTILTCDPAFQLDSIQLPLPNGFLEGKTIGINVSPLIIEYEKNEGATKKNYQNLIEYIIKNTDYNIALIPHVVEEGNDDRTALKDLYEMSSDKERICIIPDCNCMELKGFISRCTMFIGARTHATIAAYSTCVPTLVIGYSVKARGIAKDIFGTEENYVLPVQNLQKEDDLTKAFVWLDEHKINIQKHLEAFIPEYKKSIYNGVEAVRKLK